MNVNGTEVTIKDIDSISEKEIMSYINYIEEQNLGEELATLEIAGASDGNVSLDYMLRPQKFERIRRITGYLVGTIDRWNNAKRAEEHDRVKHNVMH